MSQVRKIDTKIITTEDPVEYEIDGIVQCPINHEIDLTFASALRAILRLFPEGRSRIEGGIRAAGKDVQALTRRQLADFRGGDVSMIEFEAEMSGVLELLRKLTGR